MYLAVVHLYLHGCKRRNVNETHPPTADRSVVRQLGVRAVAYSDSHDCLVPFDSRPDATDDAGAKPDFHTDVGSTAKSDAYADAVCHSAGGTSYGPDSRTN